MLSVYIPKGSSLERRPVEPGVAIDDAAVWIDMVSPTSQEDRAVEALAGIAVPTREEMQEIEVSSRLYVENGARYMTATMMCQSDTMTPKTTAVTFILASQRLITVRYDDPRPFAIVEHKLGKYCHPEKTTGPSVLVDLIDAVVDRCADLLERTGAEIDAISHDIFEPEGEAGSTNYKQILKALGRKGDLASKVRESLVSINRLLLFLSGEAEAMRWKKDIRSHLQSMRRDAASLSDHATYLSSKITFLLDAMLGVVNIDQNAIIKIFSIAAVIFMPPTLVASVYGMNFKTGMFELEWEYGYIWALGLMVLAAVVPLLIFKWKKWL